MNGVLGKSTGKNLTNYEKPRNKDLHNRVHTPDTTIFSDMREFILGDCMDYLPGTPDNFYDLAIVDPPYGIGMDNQKVRTKPSRPNTYKRANENQYKLSKWDNNAPKKVYFDELFRVSKHHIIWGANYFCEHIPSGKGWIYWDKQMGDNDFSSGEFAYQSFQIKSSCFALPSMRVKSTRIHPTQKPVQLYKWLLRNYAQTHFKILDTHVGSASSLIAFEDFGCDYVGYELDKDYYNAATKRLKDHKSQFRLKL